MKRIEIETETYAVDGAVGISRDGETIETRATLYVTPYICRKCDNVHVNIDTSVGVTVMLSLDQDDVDQIVAKLQNPYIIKEL